MKWFWTIGTTVLIGLMIIGGASVWYWQKIIHSPIAKETPLAEIKVTFPEGWRDEQMALRLKEKGVILSAGDYLGNTRTCVINNCVLQQFREKFGISSDKGMTGFLFPDTYSFLPNTDVSAVIAKQLETFQSRTTKLSLTYNKVVLASIVEREAKFDEDRPIIAGVYTNRLNNKMALEADPTVQYAKLAADNQNCITPAGLSSADCQNISWWPTVSRADLQNIKSPFNTYLNVGLPPQPICNPGLASLEAADEPAKNSYLYFVTDKDGHAHFAATLAEHNQNVAQYRQ